MNHFFHIFRIILDYFLYILKIFFFVRVKDCLYLQARIYHTLVLTEERNLAAQQFKKFDEMHPTSSPIPHLLLI